MHMCTHTSTQAHTQPPLHTCWHSHTSTRLQVQHSQCAHGWEGVARASQAETEGTGLPGCCWPRGSCIPGLVATPLILCVCGHMAPTLCVCPLFSLYELRAHPANPDGLLSRSLNQITDALSLLGHIHGFHGLNMDMVCVCACVCVRAHAHTCIHVALMLVGHKLLMKRERRGLAKAT